MSTYRQFVRNDIWPQRSLKAFFFCFKLFFIIYMVCLESVLNFQGFKLFKDVHLTWNFAWSQRSLQVTKSHLSCKTFCPYFVKGCVSIWRAGPCHLSMDIGQASMGIKSFCKKKNCFCKKSTPRKNPTLEKVIFFSHTYNFYFANWYSYLW